MKVFALFVLCAVAMADESGGSSYSDPVDEESGGSSYLTDDTDDEESGGSSYSIDETDNVPSESDGSPDKTNCNGKNFNLDLYVKDPRFQDSDLTYTMHKGGCVIGNNLNSADTVESCQKLCNADDGYGVATPSKCKAIEFGVAVGGKGACCSICSSYSTDDTKAPTKAPTSFVQVSCDTDSDCTAGHRTTCSSDKVCYSAGGGTDTVDTVEDEESGGSSYSTDGTDDEESGGSSYSTAAPTKAPTAPTTAPTPQPTNPEKPVFNPDDFDVDEYDVVADASLVTLPPTKAPTPPPTKAGEMVTTKEVVKKAVTTEIPFPFTADEAKSPAVRKSVSDGTADALGMERKNVKISKIGGVAISRRLADSITFEFTIISNDASPAAMTKLAENVKAAASEGSIVANIQKQAAANGVMTAALKSMKREVIVTTAASEITVTVTVVVPVGSPTPAPAPEEPAPEEPAPEEPAPKEPLNAGTCVAPAFGSVMAIFALSVVCAGF